MTVWLELRRRTTNELVLVNTDHVIRIEPDEGATVLVLSTKEQLSVKDNYNDVHRRLGGK